jgi:pSer/pThr/pTyr-binding forkhead associated (FHA) protein
LVDEPFAGDLAAGAGGKPPPPYGPPVQEAPLSPPVSPPAALPVLALLVKESGARLSAPRQPEFIIGRSDPVRGIFPDVDVTPAGEDTHGVSRRHARLFYRDGQYFLEDLNSTNFTFLNRQRLQPGQPYPIKDGDEIRVGLLALQVAIQ